MVVKELRHGLRARMFTSILIGTHVLLLVLMSGALLGVPPEVVHGMFWGGAALAFLLFMPLRAASTLTSESQDGTLDMLILTSIPSARIVRGKWAALMSQSLLLAASLLPYMIARYHFGGVEILSESIALICLILGSSLLTAAVVAFSSQRSIVLRIFLGLALLICAWPIGFFVVALAVEKNFGDSMFRELFLLPAWQEAAIIMCIVALVLYGTWLFIALGSSRIAPPSENHSTRKRLIYIAFTVINATIGWFICLAVDKDAVFWCLVPGTILTIFAGIDLMTEEMPYFPTVMMPFVEKRSLRAFASLLSPGWASGVLCYSLLAVITWSMAIAFATQYPSSIEEGLSIFSLFLTAAVVPVCIRINKTNPFANWWAVQWALIAAGILLSIFAGVMRASGLGVIGIFIPTTAFFGAMSSQYSSHDEMFVAAAIIGFFWLLAACVYAVSTHSDTYRQLLAEATLLHQTEKHAQQPLSTDH